jgi:D-cysteine desulfhydrase family pyridoxal phosphate-dependent enzyme
MGGNKARKLEFLIADALAKGCDTVVTTGFVQSNHVVQTAAAAARHGLATVIVLEGEPPGGRAGNLLLSDLLGAEVRFAADPAAAIAQAAEDVRARGGRPYVTPPGGSSAVGVLGFAAAMEETGRQLAAAGIEIDAVVLATGTGGTQAGMLLGAALLGWDLAVVGVSVGKTKAELGPVVVEMTAAAAAAIGSTLRVEAPGVVVHEGYYGAGYAIPDDEDFAAIRLVAQTEGLFTDPVYTGRAMKGMFDLLARGAVPGEGPILFWHTGGLPALFAFPQEPGRHRPPPGRGRPVPPMR